MIFFLKWCLVTSFIFPFARAAETKEKSGLQSWFVSEREGKPAAKIFETVEFNAKEKSSILKQTWSNFGRTSTVSLEAISIDVEKMSPSWMESHFKSADGKEEFKYRIALKRNGKFKDLKISFERVKPKPSVNSKIVPKPPNSIFFSFLPQYLAKLEPGLYTVTAIMEDVEEATLSTRALRIQKLSDQKSFMNEKCSKAIVELGGFDGNYWVSDEGRLCEFTVAMPSLRTHRVSETDYKATSSGKP